MVYHYIKLVELRNEVSKVRKRFITGVIDDPQVYIELLKINDGIPGRPSDFNLTMIENIEIWKEEKTLYESKNVILRKLRKFFL